MMITQFRWIFGIYLVWHFVNLIPYADELFGNSMPFDPKLGPTYHLFPNLLNVMNAHLFLIMLSVLSVSFTIGYKHQLCSFLLWYGWAALLNRNVFIHNPGIHFVGFLLLAMSLIPNNDNSKMTRAIYHLSWLIMGLGYTMSGIHKLQGSISWIDGSALRHILNSPLARDNFLRDFMLTLPDIFLRIATWSSLALEILFLPLGTFYTMRPFFWVAFIAFHLGIIALINFTDLTITVLMIHLFTFDPKWLPTSILNKLKME